MASPIPVIRTERLRLTLPSPAESPAVVDYYLRNRNHLECWEPRRGPDFFTVGFWERQLEGAQLEFQRDAGARLLLSLHDQPGRFIGVTNLSNIIRGAFQACHLGYSLDETMQGQGLMHEALQGILTFAFEDLGLHRVMANYQPSNERSARVLERLGFVREGFAHKLLYIDGAWRDHVLTALIRPTPIT